MNHLSRRPYASTLILAAAALQIACGGAHKEASTPRNYGSPPSSGYAGGGGSAEVTSSPAADSAGGYADTGSSYKSEGSYKPAEAAPMPAAKGADYSGPKTASVPPSMAPAPTPVSPSKPSVSKSPPPPPVVATKPSPGTPPTTPPISAKTTTTVVIGSTVPYPVGGGSVQENPSGGVLTAAIWDDNAMRASFLTFLDRYPSYGSQWGLDLKHRVTIRVEDSSGVLVGDAPLSLRTPDGGVVNLRTHGDGTALFYPKLVSPGTSQTPNVFAVAAQVGTLRTEANFAAPAADATWTIKLSGVPARAKDPALDIAFVVDCTGSMGDEISYLQAELSNVVKTVKSQHSMRRVRLGLVLYKDRGDDYVTKSFPFTEDLGTYLTQLKTAVAGGGGDMPESVNAALADTVNKLSWAGDETGRLAILVADAPPHYYADEQYTYKNAIVDLSGRGIKLVTLGASGIDKTTEYVFRQMSAYTGGRYIFLTDDSGVGDSHLTPDISGYQVEHLNKILIRTISDEAKSFKR